MKIKSVKIENLFDIFDYDISFKPGENVLIITGPNGFGKTMILNVIYNLFNRNFSFFQSLIFDKITLTLDENIKIIISKQPDKVIFDFFEGERQFDSFRNSYFDNRSELIHFIDKQTPFFRLTDDLWRDDLQDKILNTAELLKQYPDIFSELINGKNLKITSVKASLILDSIQVHLIQEQRLFKKTLTQDRRFRSEKIQTVITETIQVYAEELKQIIDNLTQQSFIKTQELDSSYPRRLTNENNILTQDEYESRFKLLKNKQEKLTEFGIFDSTQEFLDYSQDDAKALSVYLKDFEQKLSVFNDLLEKLDLFTSILNERRFTFKAIRVNRKKGFYFETNKGKELELGQLSSGEQHEVVILYELIFNVKPNVLVLLDEPEISLHITWQKEFLSDLLKIVKLQNIQVLIATHSPSIINDRWDLVYNLEKVV